MDGEVYTVILKDWPTTSCFLSDPFELLSDASIPRFITMSQPILLYLLNTHIDVLRQQGLETVHTFQQVLSHQHDMIFELRSQNQNILSAISIVASSVHLSTQQSSLEYSIGRLYDRRGRLKDSLITTSDPDIRHEIQQSLSEIDEDIHAHDARLEGLWRSTSALSLHVDTTLQLPSAPTMESPPTQSSTQHSHPTDDDPDAEQYRARQRTSDCEQTTDPNIMETEQPHIWVLNETKSPQPQASRVRIDDYTTFEELGVSVPHTQFGKWGVIVGVKCSLHAQRIPTPLSLRGRAVILDLILPTTTGRGFPHRLIGLYAPWDPGSNDDDPSSFWTAIANLCQQAPYSWCIMGDCNASLTSEETLSTSHMLSPSQLYYTTFLQDLHAIDLWSLQGDADAHSMFTFRNHLGQSIIDRLTHSEQGFLSSAITTSTLFIPATDHRAITASIVLTPPLPHSASVMLPDTVPTPSYPPRFYYPRHGEKYRFTMFADRVDQAVHAEKLAETAVSDNATFQLRYDALTRPTIRPLITEIRHINRLIYAERHTRTPLLALRDPWVASYLHAFSSMPHSSNSFISFLTETHHTLNKLRYCEQHKELQWRSVQAVHAKINGVLLRGSSKRLYQSTHDSTGPPLALTLDENPDVFITAPQQIKTQTRSYFSSLFS
ncbi:hypothetical protein BKA93DRAFT_822187 [Sparassis latifolia]